MGKTKIDASKFKVVKTLLRGGSTNAEVADFMKISAWTVSRISAAEDYAEYLQMLAARALAAKKKKYEKRPEEKPVEKPEEKPEEKKEALPITDQKLPGGTLSANYQMNRLIELISKQNEILTVLSNKVAFIVDELTK